MGSVTLAFTLQLLLQSRKEFLEVLEDCRIIDVDLPISMLYDPGLDVAPMRDINAIKWQSPFGIKGTLSIHA